MLTQSFVAYKSIKYFVQLMHFEMFFKVQTVSKCVRTMRPSYHFTFYVQHNFTKKATFRIFITLNVLTLKESTYIKRFAKKIRIFKNNFLIFS